MIKRILYIISITLLWGNLYALEVVPGLIGFGTDTRAAYGNSTNPDIYVVNTTADDDNGLDTDTDYEGSGVTVYKGSFREVIEHTNDNKFIIFMKSGEFTIRDTFDLDDNYVTIAGETAPSPGVMFKGLKLLITGDDILVSNLRIRQGDEDSPSPHADAYDVRDALNPAHTSRNPSNVVINNCSLSWSVDELMGIGGQSGNQSNNITIANSIFGESLWRSRHSPTSGITGHGAAILIGEVTNLAIIRNFIVHNNYRQITIGNGTTIVAANNYIYNPGEFGVMIQNYPTPNTTASITYTGNVVEGGANSSFYSDNRIFRIGSGAKTDCQVYLNDNVCDDGATTYTQTSASDWSKVRDQGNLEGDIKVTSPPISITGYTDLGSANVKDHVLANAGAYPDDRDAVDERLVDDAINDDQTNGILRDSVTLTDNDCTATPGDPMECCTALNTGPCNQVPEAGWPTITENTASHTDFPSDPHGDSDGDGYTNLEEWVHAFTIPEAPANVGIQGFDFNGFSIQ